MAEAEASGSTKQDGPWDFRYIRSLKSLERFDDVGPCIMLASPGMMQNGVSRELLERWAPDPKNGVVITGYSVEGTMAKILTSEPEKISAIMTKGGGSHANRMRGGGQDDQFQIPRRCSVDEFAFAAHVDGNENREFVEEVSPKFVILVHGEKSQMTRFKSRLLGLKAKSPNLIDVFCPKNCEELRIPFKTDKIAKVVGRLAEASQPLILRPKLNPGEAQPEGSESLPQNIMSGVLVKNDFTMNLMAPEDLKEYTGLNSSVVVCRQHLRLGTAGPDQVRWALEGVFGTVHEIGGKDEASHKALSRFQVFDSVTVTCGPDGDVDVEWEGSIMNDSIADGVIAALMTAETSPAAVKHSMKHKQSQPHSHEPLTPNPHSNLPTTARLSRLLMFLESQFGPALTPLTRPRLASDHEDEVSTEPTGKRISDSYKSASPEDLSPEERTELDRLHSLGIPVPGLELIVDDHTAILWLENLEIECDSKLLTDRIRAVIDRGLETNAAVASSA